ncbi:hypothetical protein QTQ03_10690 [Micromonospora sp. WMMA1363]|uniref:hypothetical protein n=1 Tax=Micromonospora sp. WMMA1363 TaxID=3053985 RepID=UPI00259C84B8|nr:hypothetical protein [Micromonospora sp. WMMA1363]MDM4720023.1 hypothetical protein [Micromonospora sp. WMMA1363]
MSQPAPGMGQRLACVAAMAGEMTQACVHLRDEVLVAAPVGQGEGLAEVLASASCGTRIMRHPPCHLVERRGSGKRRSFLPAAPTNYRFADPVSKVCRNTGVQVATADSAVSQP